MPESLTQHKNSTVLEPIAKKIIQGKPPKDENERIEIAK